MPRDGQDARYRVLRPLASGGMAEVSLAEDTLLGRWVALKKLRTAGDVPALKRLRREALVGASLSHPNLVSVYDVWVQDDGDLVIVMEYVAGDTLRDRIRQRGALVPGSALRILGCVAAGLDAVHLRGIVHRDVKPANILLGLDGQVKLADLGIASGDDHTKITTSGEVLGTFRYMAPEQLEGAPSKPSMDIYALAAVAFETLCGKKARPEPNPLALAHAIATQPPPDLRDCWNRAPVAAAEVLKRGMAADPALRPRSASELIGRLKAAFDPDTTQGDVPALVGAAADLRAQPVRSRPRLREGGGAVAVPPRRPGAHPRPQPAGRPAPRTPSPGAQRAKTVPPDPPARAQTPPPPGSAFDPKDPPKRERRRPDALVLASLAALLVVGAAVAAIASGGGGGGPTHRSASTPSAAGTTTAAASPGATHAAKHHHGRAAASTASTHKAAGAAASSAASGASGGSGVSGASSGSGVSGASGGSSATGGSPTAVSSASAGTPSGAVQAFYERSAAHEYAAAWELADANMRSQLGGYASFQGQMSHVRAITFHEAQTAPGAGAASATVAVRTTSVLSDRTQNCSGTIQTVRTSGGNWLLDHISISCVPA